MSEDILEKLNNEEAQIFDLPEMQDSKDFDDAVCGAASEHSHR